MTQLPLAIPPPEEDLASVVPPPPPVAPTPPPPALWTGAPLSLPLGCALGTGLLLVFLLAFLLGNLYTLGQLTNPYVRSSALVKGFFARLAQGQFTGQKERYLATSLSAGGLTLHEKTGWLFFGKPASLTGQLTNSGDRIVDSVTLALWFVDGTGRVVTGGEVVIGDILKPGETVGFTLTEKEAGFSFPKATEKLNRVYRIADCHFYEPPDTR